MELFECFAGDRHFFVMAPEFSQGLKAAWERLGAKTTTDLPKPFAFKRINPDKVVVVHKRK